ncbi:cadherin repeat domain-containing protein [Candidatus Woesearchaeota archaeon]|nr:cadherin repeat domain-containing protein [Candidatus Woesearchaeota archaeon]
MEEKKNDLNLEDIPRVEVYGDEEAEKRRNSFSTYVLIAILLLGGFYLWNENFTTGNVVADTIVNSTDQSVQASADLNNSPEKDSDLVVKEFFEGDLVTFQNLAATDPEGKPLFYTFTSPLNEKGEWQTKKGDKGEYLVTVTANDGETLAQQKVLVVVKEKQKTPVREKNNAPVLGDVEKLTWREEDFVKLNVKAEDPDGDAVKLTFTTPLNDQGEWQTKKGDKGTYKILVTASDTDLITQKEYTVIINPANEPPVINSPDTIEVREGERITLTPEIKDLEGDNITVTYSGWMNSDTKELDYNSAGTYKVTITASDGSKESSKTIKVIVQDVNRAPVFNSGAFD